VKGERDTFLSPFHRGALGGFLEILLGKNGGHVSGSMMAEIFVFLDTSL
jgi:hypothetical protein